MTMQESVNRPTISSSKNAGGQTIIPLAPVKVKYQSRNVVQDTRSIKDYGHTSECVEADYQAIPLVMR